MTSCLVSLEFRVYISGVSGQCVRTIEKKYCLNRLKAVILLIYRTYTCNQLFQQTVLQIVSYIGLWNVELNWFII